MVKEMRRYGFFILIILMSIMFQPIVSFAGTRGVTDDTIVVGSYQTLSGPAAMTSVVGKGADAYFRFINEQGGIHGRKIRFIMEDDQAHVARVVATVKRFVERDRVFALVAGLNPGGTIATMSYLTQHRVPHVSVVGSSTLAVPPKKYLFVVRPIAYVETRLMARYAVEELKAKRIGIFYEDSDFGTDALKGIVDELQQRGIEPVQKVSYTQEDPEFRTQALLLREADADLVFLLSLLPFTARILRETEKIDFKPTWFTLSVNNTPITLRLAGKASEGLIAPGSYADITSDFPPIVEYREWFSKYYPKEDAYNPVALVGWSAAQIFSEAVRRAGRDLTVDKFISAMETFKDWEEGIAYRLTFGPDRRDGQRAMRMSQVKEGKFVYLSDFYEYDPAD